MLRGTICVFLFILISNINSEKESQLKDVQEKKRMLGVDTVHDSKIDKNSITYGNMKRGKHDLGNSGNQETKPSWHYSSFPDETSVHVQQFKVNMSECLKEVQSKEKGVQRLSPKKNSPVHGECLIACVFKRNGVIHKGKVHKENLLALVNKFYAKEVKLMKKLEREVDRCLDSSTRGGGDDCALAARLNDCTNTLMEYNKHMLTVKY